MSRLVDQLGAGPFFFVESVPLENVLSRGEPAQFVHKPPTEAADLRSSLDERGLRDFFEMVSGGAEGWDGSKPLRPVDS